MILPQHVQQWPEEWRVMFEERAGIMADSGVVDAERKAEADTRRQAALRGQGGLFTRTEGDK